MIFFIRIVLNFGIQGQLLTVIINEVKCYDGDEVGEGEGGEGSYFRYILLNEFQTMILQLAKRSSDHHRSCLVYRSCAKVKLLWNMKENLYVNKVAT